jgi:aminoglycoside phosphotransferase (APT) family kinase protein
LGDATWARARGWALWKALITLVRALETDPQEAEKARRVIDDVVAEHRSAA